MQPIPIRLYVLPTTYALRPTCLRACYVLRITRTARGAQSCKLLIEVGLGVSVSCVLWLVGRRSTVDGGWRRMEDDGGRRADGAAAATGPSFPFVCLGATHSSLRCSANRSHSRAHSASFFLLPPANTRLTPATRTQTTHKHTAKRELRRPRTEPSFLRSGFGCLPDRVSVKTFSIFKRGVCEMSPLFKLQNHCSTRAVQLLVQVFHLVLQLSLVTCAPLVPCGLWCSPHYKIYTHYG
jgi:hypothetical protein